MKKTYFLLTATLLLLLPASVPARQSGDAEEDAAVRQVVNYYLKGITDGDVESMKKAFHPKAKYLSMRYGDLDEIPLEQVYRNMRDNAHRQVGKDPSPKRIVSVDVRGLAATAKVEMDYSNGRLTEYLSLVKFNDGWKIVSKVSSGVQGQVALK